MTDSQLTILVNGIPAIIGAAFAGFALLQSRKNAKQVQAVDDKVTDNTAKVQLGNDKIDVLHDATNGMKTALVQATARAEHAEGKQEERSEERARVEQANHDK